MKLLFVFILVVMCSFVGPDGDSHQDEYTRDLHHLITVRYTTNVKELTFMRSTNALKLKKAYTPKSVGYSWPPHIFRAHLCLVVLVTMLLCFTVHQTLGIDQLTADIENVTKYTEGERNNIEEMVREMNEFQSNYSHVNLKLLKMGREMNKLRSDLEKEERAVETLGMDMNCWSKSWNRRTAKLVKINTEEWKSALEGFERGIQKTLQEETGDLKEFKRKTEPIVAHSKWVANIYDSHIQYVNHQVREAVGKPEE